MTTADDIATPQGDDEAHGSGVLSLPVAAARKLATTTKTAPQTQGSTPRWLLRMLPWEEAAGGTYRVNRRLSVTREDGRDAEVALALAAGHAGEPDLPGTFPDYDPGPPEYPLSVAQTLLRVHTRISDLYSSPMDQVEEQVKLTVEALRERQEAELISNPELGLLAKVAPGQRVTPRSGPPTPDDLDELLRRRRKTRFFLAHPKAIAAFGRECTRRGVYPPTASADGRPVLSWRGVPVLPCSNIPLTAGGITSILAMRTGLKDKGVIGLRQTGLEGEREPGLTVRLRGIDPKGIASYLMSAYYSVAVLVPDALGVLADIETGN
jgi:hypothetical protein